MTWAATRILVVDDFRAFRQFVRSKLESEFRFYLEEAADAAGAIQKSQQLEPDLILLDIGLPDRSGIDAQKEISSLVPSAKILFLSACSDAEVINSAFRNGAKGYISKAQAARDLLPAVQAVLRGEIFVSSGLKHESRESLPEPGRFALDALT